MIEELENALENALNDIDGISFSIDSEENEDGLSFEIDFDYDDFDGNEDDNWDEQVEAAVEDVIEEYGGSYYWDDCTILYTIPK